MVKLSELNKDYYKPREAAKILNCTVKTIQNYCISKRLDEVRTSTNKRLIPKHSLINELNKRSILIEDDLRSDVIYARVSTSKQKSNGDLDRQIQKLSIYVVDKNPKDLLIFKDVASGLNDNRKGLLKLLKLVSESKVDRIFIMNKDRLTRFGFNYLNEFCKLHNTTIVVVDEFLRDDYIDDELVEDITSIFRCYSGKIYELRSKFNNETFEKIKELSKDNLNEK